ncbi:MAG: cation-translocating P-type ATPase [Bacteroidia bacterium]
MAVVEASYRVVGMSCQSCARSVETLLENIPGVEKAKVYFATQEVLVRYETQKTSFSTLQAALAPAGYMLLPDTAAQSLHQRRFLRRLLGYIILTGILAGWGGLLHFFPVAWPAYVWVAYYAASLVAVGLVGMPFFFRPAWQQLRFGQLTMDTLVSLSLSGSLVLGTIELYQGSHGHALSAAAEILFFVLVGRYLEEKVRARAQRLMESLSALAVPTSRRLREGRAEEVPTSLIQPGEWVEILPQTTVPLDGVVVRGHSFVNESLLTGEAFPVVKEEGSRVWAGTQNLSGTLWIQVEAGASETFLAQLVARLERAQRSQARLQRLADRVAGVFVLVVLALAAFTLLYHLWRSAEGLFPWERALSVLVISCPCALGLATPLAVQLSIQHAAESQMLLREVAQLETLPEATLWAFDKTGTLTQGRATVQEATWYAPAYAPYLLRMCMASLHPLAQALAEDLRRQQIKPAEAPLTLEELPGKGLVATFPVGQIFLGSPAWLAQWHPTLALSDGLAVAAATPQEPIGLFRLKDPVRSSLRPFIQELQRAGKRVVLLTGDASKAAEEVAHSLGIREVYGGLSPMQKAEWIEARKREGEKVAFVGDGLNDVLALQAAHVGIAVYRSAGPAAHSAGIALLCETEKALPALYRLAHRLRRITAQNLFWAFAYNLIAIPLAMGLWPGLYLTPGFSALLMSLSSVAVVLNSLRLRHSA